MIIFPAELPSCQHPIAAEEARIDRGIEREIVARLLAQAFPIKQEKCDRRKFG